jgi:hypothetical protein
LPRHVNYDPSTNFSGTYAWLPEGPLHRHLRPTRRCSTIGSRRSQRSDKGYQRTEAPDFLVRYDLSAERKLDVDTYNSTFYRGYGY